LSIERDLDGRQVVAGAILHAEHDGGLDAFEVVEPLRTVVADEGRACHRHANLKLLARGGEFAGALQRLGARVRVDALVFGRVCGGRRSGESNGSGRRTGTGQKPVQPAHEPRVHRHSFLNTLFPAPSK
jgi:hypothetical protein